MDIGIITFHFPSNCGAMLQCVALQRALEQRGHRVQVIDYEPVYHANRYAVDLDPWQTARDRAASVQGTARLTAWARGFGHAVKARSGADQRRVRRGRFTAFMTQYMNLTRRYATIDELRADPPRCGLYITGSDQVWNPSITDGRFDPAYFCDFGDDGAMRIAYAVSVAMTEACGTEALARALGRLDAVGLRESTYLPQVRQACQMAGVAAGRDPVPVEVQCDPVFLLEPADYDVMAAADVACDGPYVLTYTTNDPTREAVVQAARDLGRAVGLPVVNAANDTSKQAGDDTWVEVGPSELLAYERHAAYLVTNSFHGMAFALLFGTPFAAMPHSVTGNRLVELGEVVQVGDHVCADPERLKGAALAPVDWQAASARIAAMRAEGLGYLDRYAGAASGGAAGGHQGAEADRRPGAGDAAGARPGAAPGTSPDDGSAVNAASPQM